uniref:Family with sequence similarity 180 member A n=1 Tax=Xiphophorus maculatus TaxID=8083 RepID=A0A3B5Q7C5_XIPMA
RFLIKGLQHHLCRFFSVVKTYFLYSSQILLSGVELNKDNNVFLLDEELASMRKGREFLSQINDGIPRTLISTELMIKTQEARRKSPLTRDQFENQVLSMVYSALQVGVQRNKEEREAWGGALIQLANITTYDLRGDPRASPCDQPRPSPATSRIGS